MNEIDFTCKIDEVYKILQGWWNSQKNFILTKWTTLTLLAQLTNFTKHYNVGETHERILF